MGAPFPRFQEDRKGKKGNGRAKSGGRQADPLPFSGFSTEGRESPGYVCAYGGDQGVGRKKPPSPVACVRMGSARDQEDKHATTRGKGHRHGQSNSLLPGPPKKNCSGATLNVCVRACRFGGEGSF